MYVKALRIQRFRGFHDLTIKPKGHVVVMGPPGSGRSDLLEALIRVLDPEASRVRTTTEIDFFQKSTAQPIKVEVTLAELGPDLEQRFLDELELWDRTADQLISELDTPDVIDQERFEWVLRIEHRASWVDAEQFAEESLIYPKFSEGISPSAVRRADLRELGFATMRFTGGRILDLGSRASFRAVVDDAPGADFATAASEYVRDVEAAAGSITRAAQVQEALATVLSPILEVVGVQLTKPLQAVQFGPEGGSLNGLLRTLAPSLDTGDGSGPLPIWRHGSTTTNAVRIAEGLARTAEEADFGAR